MLQWQRPKYTLNNNYVSRNIIRCYIATTERQRYTGLYILLKKTTAAKNEVTLSYYKVRGLYFLAVVFVRSIVTDVCPKTFQKHVNEHF